MPRGSSVKILVHICCGPCAIVPLRRLRAGGAEVRGVFANPNVHPYAEWRKRDSALATFARAEGFDLLPTIAYEPVEWLRAVAFRESERCRLCYHIRLQRVARLARRGRFDAFSTTLLYSKFQKHDLVREIGAAAGQEAGVPFHYEDWREGWSEGVEASRALGLYRQTYCGCLLSEEERYAPRRELAP
jgi:predicted adenine nucleotide alpha hydrolase (AANH) superfamily ATPase